MKNILHTFVKINYQKHLCISRTSRFVAPIILIISVKKKKIDNLSQALFINLKNLL